MRQLAGLLDGLLGEPLRGFQIAQQQQVEAHIGERRHAPRLAIEMSPLPLGRVVDRQGALELRARLGKGAEMEQAHADAGMAHLAAAGVIEPLRQSEQLVRHGERRTLPAAGEVAGELAPGHANELDRVANLEAKLTSTAKRGVGFRAGIASRSRQRVAQCDLQLELIPPPAVLSGDLAEQGEAAVKLRHRFGGGAACNRNPRRLEPEADGALGEARLRQMMRHQLGPGIDDVAEPSIIRLGDARMQRLTLGPQ